MGDLTTYDGYFYMPWIGQVITDFLGYLEGQHMGLCIVHVIRPDHDADLTTRVDGIGVCNAAEGSGQFFQFNHPFDVVFGIIPSGTGPGTRYGIRCGDQKRDRRYDFLILIVVMRNDCVLHFLRFAVSFGIGQSDFRMRAFHLVIQSFSDIVQKAAASGQSLIQAQFGSHHARQKGHFLGVFQRILPVAGAEPQPADHLFDFLVHGLQLKQIHGFLSFDQKAFFDLLPCPYNHLFDTGLCDLAARHQFHHRHAGDFPADRIKTGDHDGLRRIIHHDFHFAGRFKGPYIPAVLTDNTRFDLIIRQWHHGYAGLRRLIDGTSVDREGDDFLRFPIRIGPRRFHDLPDFKFRLLPHVADHFIIQLLFGFFRRQFSQRFQTGAIFG